MPTLNFQGSLLYSKQGNGDRGPWTSLEFSPVDGSSFTVFANGHVDLAQYLRKDMDWSLGCNVGRNGKLYVEKVSGAAIKAKS